MVPFPIFNWLPSMGNCRSKGGVEETERQSDDNLNNTSRNNIEGHVVQQPSPTLGSGSSDSYSILRPSEKTTSSSTNEELIVSTKAELNDLLERIGNFQGIVETDKNYRYLDEMLTRCILKLDKIECGNSVDRSNRKQAIKEVNQAIAILERKLEINSDIRQLESNLSQPAENCIGSENTHSFDH